MAKQYWVQKSENGKWVTRLVFHWNTAVDQKNAQAAFDEGFRQEFGCWRLCVVEVKVEDSHHSCCDE